MKRSGYVGLAALGVLCAIWSSCAKQHLPLAPDVSAVSTPAANPIAADESIIEVKTLAGTSPVIGIICDLNLAGTKTTLTTDDAGRAIFKQKASGDFTISLPEQGEVMTSQVSGTAVLGKSIGIELQAVGGAISVTPTVIQYSQAGGNYTLTVTYDRGSSTMDTRLCPQVLNLPKTWTAGFSEPILTHGKPITLTVNIPAGSQVNATDLAMQAQALSRRVSVKSAPFVIAKDWITTAGVKVVVNNGGVPMTGINYTITDSKGKKYNGTTTNPGIFQNIDAIGPISVFIPKQGVLHDNQKNASVTQGEQKVMEFEVGGADVKVTVKHEGNNWPGIALQITDFNSKKYEALTDTEGEFSFYLDAIGSFQAQIKQDLTKGILVSTVNGTANQDQSEIPITFQGRQGSLTLGTSAVNYVFNAGTYDLNLTYTNTGNINYRVKLVHAPTLPALGTNPELITQGLGKTIIQNGETTYSRYVVPRACKSVYQNCKFTITKVDSLGNPVSAGNQLFSFDSALFNINSDWGLIFTNHSIPGIIMCKSSPSEDWWYSNANISYTISGHNIPAGTSVNVTNWIYMPKSWPYPGWLANQYENGTTYPPLWKYWHARNSGERPDLNMTPGEPNTPWGGTVTLPYTNTYQIKGWKNPYYGERVMESNGSVIINAELFGKTQVGIYNLTY